MDDHGIYAATGAVVRSKRYGVGTGSKVAFCNIGKPGKSAISHIPVITGGPGRSVGKVDCKTFAASCIICRKAR